jgi:hypothetical protein
MQDVYMAIAEQKAKIVTTIKTRGKKFPPADAEEAVNLAKADNDNYKLLDSLIDKQIELIKIHARLVAPKIKSEAKEGTGSEEVISLSDDTIAQLKAMAKEEYLREIHYDLTDD